MEKEDILRWCEGIEQRMEGLDPDLKARLGEVRDGFQELLSIPSSDTYRKLCSRAYLIYIEAAARDYIQAKKRKSARLVLDTDENLIVYCEKSRQSGEADIIAERGHQKKEEAYLFLRLSPAKGGRTKRSVWIEVGNREKRDSVSIPIFQLVAIIKRHADEGAVIEASLYHYHPDPPGMSTKSMISPTDLLFAARYGAIFGSMIQVPLDFRVVNKDGIYAFRDVTFDKIISMGEKGLCGMDSLRGKVLVSFLARYGMECSFERIPARPHRIKN